MIPQTSMAHFTFSQEGMPDRINTLSDGHVHTHMCRHATGTMEDYVKSAINMGLQEIIFLEHMEEGVSYFERTWLTEEDFDYYFTEGARLREIYGKRITIGLGVEAGYNPDSNKTLLKRLARRKWDRIGLSYHYCRFPGLSQHLNLLSRKKENIELIARHDPDTLLCQYFDTLIEAVRTIPAQVLCHLDAGLRHQPGLELKSHHRERIRQLLEEVKQAGMALEINTSGYAIRNKPFPQPEIILQAKDMGIALVAGSDAHKPDEVGRYFDKLPALLRPETHP